MYIYILNCIYHFYYYHYYCYNYYYYHYYYYYFLLLLMYIILYIWSMLLSLRVRDSAKKRKTSQVLLRRAWLSCCICCCNVRRCSSDFLDSYAPHPGLKLGLRSKPIGNHPLAPAHSLAIWSHNSPFSVGISPKLAGKMMTNHDQPSNFWSTEYLVEWYRIFLVAVQGDSSWDSCVYPSNTDKNIHIASHCDGIWRVKRWPVSTGLAPPPSLSVSLATVLPGSKLSSHLRAQLVTRLTSSILLMGQIHYENLSIDSDHILFSTGRRKLCTQLETKPLLYWSRTSDFFTLAFQANLRNRNAWNEKCGKYGSPIFCHECQRASRTARTLQLRIWSGLAVSGSPLLAVGSCVLQPERSRLESRV